MEEKTKVDMGLRPSISIIVGVGWLIFIILWLAFVATDYPWEKNLSILLLSILIVFLLLGGMWAIWSIRMVPKPGWEMFKVSGFRKRISISIIIPLAAMIFLIIWFWFYAVPFSVWQNIAVFLVTLLAMGGILGAIWARWSMKHGNEMEKFENIGEEIGKKIEDALKDKKDDEPKDKTK